MKHPTDKKKQQRNYVVKLNNQSKQEYFDNLRSQSTLSNKIDLYQKAWLYLLDTYFFNISLNVLRRTFFNICKLPFLRSPNIGKIRVKVGPKINYFSYFISFCTNRIAVFNTSFSLICSQPRDKQNRARNIFWITSVSLFSWKIRFQNSPNYCYKKWTTHYSKKRGHGFVQQSVRNVCAKFKVDCLSRFRTGPRQVFTPRNHSLTKFLQPRKLQYQILFKTSFLIKLPSVKP